MFLPKTPGVQKEIITAEDAFTKVGGIITMVESVATNVSKTATGADKLRASTPLVMAAVQGSELMLGKKIRDKAAYEKACAGIASATADLLNSLEAPALPVDAAAPQSETSANTLVRA